MSEVFIEFGGQRHAVLPGETVLKTLQRAGERIESSCEAGVCQSCIVKAESGKVPPVSQAGLKESLKLQGCFLACMCRPIESMRIVPAADAVPFRGEVSIEDIENLGADVVCVSFKRPEALEFRAGQFLTFTRSDGIARSYSIASLPLEKTRFQIHVRKVREGRMSEWFHAGARQGDVLSVAGPRGDCFYSSVDQDKPITLIGTGTGMAPLLAVAQDALFQGHRGEIHLFEGALEESRIYLRSEMEKLARRYFNVRYTPCVLKGDSAGPLAPRVGDLSQIVLEQMEQIKELKAGRFYLCGDATLVQSLKKKLFLAGASLKQIHADPFVAAAPQTRIS